MGKVNILEMFRSLNNTITSNIFLNDSRKKITAFMRNRKMPFCDIIYFIMSAHNRSLQSELDDYFRKKGVDGVSRQAFSKSRENLKHEAFITLNDSLIEKFEREDGEISAYRGYRLFSVDGTIIDLPNTPQMREEFGFSSNGTELKYAKGLAITAFDVLNKLTVFAELFRYDDSEKRRILPIVDEFSQLDYPKSIWLLDRGYPSFELFSRFEANHQNYVVRVSTQTLKEVYEATALDQTVTVTRKSRTLRLRVVNVSLDNGQIERLVTNLPSDFTPSELKELYMKRWGIETEYRFLKQKLCLEVFTGETKTAVLQDFHAGILLLNIAAIGEREQEDILKDGDMTKKQKNVYYPNKTKLIGDIKRDFVTMILSDNPFHKVFIDLRLYSYIKRYAYHHSYLNSFPRHSIKTRGQRSPHPKQSL